MITVMIDIGHYKNDSGAVYNGLREVEFNIKIANLLVTHLEKSGVKVLISTGTLQERVDLEHKYKPDYFVSLHTNSGGGDGTEVLVYKKEGIQLKIAESIINQIVSNKVNNSRGVKERPDLFVLRKTYAPAVLVEFAFIDTKDIECIDTDLEQDLMAKCIAKGLLEAIGLTYVETQPNDTTKKTLYRVCTGSYADRNNALREVDRLSEKGVKAFIHICEEGK